MPFAIRAAYINGTRFAIGTASVQNYIRGALNLLAQGKIDAEPLSGTKMDLTSVAEGYERFDKDKSVFKVLLRP
jgi:threonine dehydrogenase-like Zn-dependent dehydrogenase